MLPDTRRSGSGPFWFQCLRSSMNFAHDTQPRTLDLPGRSVMAHIVSVENEPMRDPLMAELAGPGAGSTHVITYRNDGEELPKRNTTVFYGVTSRWCVLASYDPWVNPNISYE